MRDRCRVSKIVPSFLMTASSSDAAPSGINLVLVPSLIPPSVSVGSGVNDKFWDSTS